MQYQNKILLLSFVASVVLSLIIVPILRKLKVGQIERTEGPQSHLKKQGTPTMGGIIMILVIIAIGAFIYWDFAKDQMEVATALLPLIGVAVGFGFIGFIDDLGLTNIFNIILTIGWIVGIKKHKRVKPKSKNDRTFNCCSSIYNCTCKCISHRNRHIYTICKRIYYASNLVIYTICSTCNGY